MSLVPDHLSVAPRSLLCDVHVADEAPSAYLELGTFAASHFHSLIAEEGDAPGDNPGPRRDP
jgi:hypothetical protein